MLIRALAVCQPSPQSQPMRHLATIASACFLSAFGLAACGGSGQASAADQAFIAAANAICKASKNRLYGSGGIPSGASNAEAKEWVTQTWVPIVREEHEKIAALNPPQDSEEEIVAYVTALEDAVVAAENDPGTQLTLGSPEDQNIEKLAADIGLDEMECSID